MLNPKKTLGEPIKAPTDLVMALVMSASSKLHEDLLENEVDLFQDAVVILQNDPPETAEIKMKDAQLIAACVMEKLARVEKQDFFMGACLTALIMKANDITVPRSFRLAVAGVIDYLNHRSDENMVKTAKTALAIVETCKKRGHLVV